MFVPIPPIGLRQELVWHRVRFWKWVEVLFHVWAPWPAECESWHRAGDTGCPRTGIWQDCPFQFSTNLKLTILLQLVGTAWGNAAWVWCSRKKVFPCLDHLSSFTCYSLFVVPVQLSWGCAVKITALCSQWCCSLGRSISGVTPEQVGAFCWSWGKSRVKQWRQPKFLWLVSYLVHS